MAKLGSRIVLILFLVTTGCATVKVYDVQPSYHRISSDEIDVLLEAQPAAGQNYFNSFRFVVTNKTDKPMEIDWLKTYYLLNGRKNGQFGWEGMTFKELEALTKNPSVTIGPGQTVTGVIFPIKLLARYNLQDAARLGGPGPEGQFALGPLPAGKNGMLLSIIHENKRYEETLLFDVHETTVSK